MIDLFVGYEPLKELLSEDEALTFMHYLQSIDAILINLHELDVKKDEDKERFRKIILKNYAIFKGMLERTA